MTPGLHQPVRLEFATLYVKSFSESAQRNPTKSLKNSENLCTTTASRRGVQESQVKIFCFVQVFTCGKKKKKCLRSNCSSHNISLQKCWNYLSTWKRSLCSCCHTLLWSAGNLCAVLPPAAPKPGEKEADRDMLWWPRPFYLLLAFTGPVYQTIDFLKNKTACQEQKNSYSCKQLLPVCGMETASYLVSSSMKLAISWSAFAAQTILFTEHFSLGDHPTEVTK